MNDKCINFNREELKKSCPLWGLFLCGYGVFVTVKSLWCCVLRGGCFVWLLVWLVVWLFCGEWLVCVCMGVGGLVCGFCIVLRY